VGLTVVKIFPDNQPAVGKRCALKNLPFKIIGVLFRKRPKRHGPGPGRSGLAPFSTVQKKLMGITFANSLTASASSEQLIDEARQEINQSLPTAAAGPGATARVLPSHANRHR